ncbi:MAG: sensor histidine kinase [Lachnospira sp.]
MQQYDQVKYYEYSQLQIQLQREYDTSEYYKMLISHDEKQHILIHDIKKHLNTIAFLNEQGNSEKINTYIKSIIDSDVLKTPKRLCDNDIMNMLLYQYINKCHELNIQFDIDIRSKTLDNIDDNDCTSLFSNLLDNSFAAASDSTNSYISLSITTVESSKSILITLINSCDTNPFSSDGKLRTNKKDDKFHGYGLKSIKNTIEKYDGNIEQYYDQNEYLFHTIILLN